MDGREKKWLPKLASGKRESSPKIDDDGCLLTNSQREVHIRSTSVRFVPRSCSLFLALLTRSSYFAEKVLFGSPFHDGGMLHNNPSAIACREGSTLWQCPAAENLLISVGCGDMQVSCGGRSSFARLWSAFSHKLSPAKEEEIRALWGADVRRRYERVDPRLDLPDIPLDNLQMMLDALPAARASMSGCDVFRQQIQRVSWMLIASSFYAQLVKVKKCGARKVVSLSLASRLEQDVARVWQKWPDAFFRAGNKELHFARIGEDHCLQISCVTAKHDLDVTFNCQGRTSSISGFPLVLSSLEVDPPSSHESILGKRKRCSLA